MKLGIQTIAFDAYGTLFDVHSVIALCDWRFPGRGAELSRLWRAKQLEYTWLRSLSEQYEDFWMVTESALAFCVPEPEPCVPSPNTRRVDGILSAPRCLFRCEAGVGQTVAF